MTTERQSQSKHNSGHGPDNGRFEGHVFNTQLLSSLGAAATEPLYGGVVDPDEDDPEDIKDAVALSREVKSAGHNGGGRFPIVNEDFEEKQAIMKRKYDALVEQGYDPEEARRAVIDSH